MTDAITRHRILSSTYVAFNESVPRTTKQRASLGRSLDVSINNPILAHKQMHDHFDNFYEVARTISRIREIEEIDLTSPSTYRTCKSQERRRSSSRGVDRKDRFFDLDDDRNVETRGLSLRVRVNARSNVEFDRNEFVSR